MLFSNNCFSSASGSNSINIPKSYKCNSDNSFNVATRHILNSSMFLTAEVAEALSLRISDILEYSPTADAFVQAIGAHNVATLKEMTELHLYDFGIFIELEPDEEEKQMLENNIQTALSQQLIDLDDAIDIREVRNVKLANQLLKIKRKKKQERDQAIQQQNIKAQADANAQTQQAAAQAEIQKNQAKAEAELNIETKKSEMRMQALQQEVMLKKDLMNHEFDLNMKMRESDEALKKQLETDKEDRKDERTKIQASQQSELIEQRKTGKPPKRFESSGNDILGGGLGLDSFDPQIGN